MVLLSVQWEWVLLIGGALTHIVVKVRDAIVKKLEQKEVKVQAEKLISTTSNSFV